MGHHWSDGYTTAELAARDEKIAATIRDKKAQEKLLELGHLLLDSPDALKRLEALLSPATEVFDL
jgi:hypothetical protein